MDLSDWEEEGQIYDYSDYGDYGQNFSSYVLNQPAYDDFNSGTFISDLTTDDMDVSSFYVPYSQSTFQQILPREIKQEIPLTPSYHPNFIVNSTPTPIPTPTISTQTTESDIVIIFETQPPVEVRTRTPNEIRTFTVIAKVKGDYRKAGATIMKVSLFYAPNGSSPVESVKKDILGGTKTVAIHANGNGTFDNLTISESSTKNKEREFLLQVALIRNDGQELMKIFSRPFYAYSHKKVLQRRGSVQLKTLSKSWGRMSGGELMHVIGSPFIQGPALAIIFRTAQGDLVTKPTEFYSDSVLFFELPALPIPPNLSMSPDAEIGVTVLVTNDGRTFSNPLAFTFITDASMVRSRI